MDSFKCYQIIGSRTRWSCCMCRCKICSAYFRRFKRPESRKARRLLRRWDIETNFGEKDAKLRPNHFLKEMRTLEKYALSKI